MIRHYNIELETVNVHSGGNQYGNIALKDKRVVLQNIGNSKVVFDLSLGTTIPCILVRSLTCSITCRKCQQCQAE